MAQKTRMKPAKASGSVKAAVSVRKAAAKVPAAKVAPAPESAAPEEADNLFKRSDLLAAVAARSDLPKSQLRDVIELVLEEMGQALSSGQDLAVPPLGRIKQQRRKEMDGAEVLGLRLRRKTDQGKATEPQDIV